MLLITGTLFTAQVHTKYTDSAKVDLSSRVSFHNTSSLTALGRRVPGPTEAMGIDSGHLKCMVSEETTNTDTVVTGGTATRGHDCARTLLPNHSIKKFTQAVKMLPQKAKLSHKKF